MTPAQQSWHRPHLSKRKPPSFPLSSSRQLRACFTERKRRPCEEGSSSTKEEDGQEEAWCRAGRGEDAPLEAMRSSSSSSSRSSSKELSHSRRQAARLRSPNK